MKKSHKIQTVQQPKLLKLFSLTQNKNFGLVFMFYICFKVSKYVTLM